jgi:hypothetical protein
MKHMPERRLPRANAFAARGVTLKYPDRSWSGVSARDGNVVLAMLHGAAEGLLDYGDSAGVNLDESVSLRVIRIGGEYWAKWGSATRPRTAGLERFFPPFEQQARWAASPA